MDKQVIWVIMSHEPGSFGTDLVGLYSTKEKAERYLNKIGTRHIENVWKSKHFSGVEYFVKDWILDNHIHE